MEAGSRVVLGAYRDAPRFLCCCTSHWVSDRQRSPCRTAITACGPEEGWGSLLLSRTPSMEHAGIHHVATQVEIRSPHGAGRCAAPSRCGVRRSLP